MDPAQTLDVIFILDQANAMTIATVGEEGYPPATRVSYVNDGLTVYFGCAAESQKAENIARSDKVSLTVSLPYASWDEIRDLSIALRQFLAEVLNLSLQPLDVCRLATIAISGLLRSTCASLSRREDATRDRSRR